MSIIIIFNSIIHLKTNIINVSRLGVEFALSIRQPTTFVLSNNKLIINVVDERIIDICILNV